jgi:hypothetical protein
MTTADIVTFIKKNPVSIGCGILSVALLATLYLRSDQIPAAEAELNEKSAESERYALNLKYSAQLKEQLAALVAYNREIDSRVVRASQLTTNTQFFYKLEADSGVKFLDLRQTTAATVAKPAKGTVLPVAFAVTAEGTLPQLLNFLQMLENGPRYCRVNIANVAGNVSNRGAALTLALNLELVGQP